jgi:death-on-curing protein
MPAPIWLLPEIAQAVHKRQLAEHGGGQGVRDAGLLESALLRPQNIYIYSNGQTSLAQLAAAYAYGLARNHPFVDGNKRTALVLSLLFLRLNKKTLTASQEDLYAVFMALAKGDMPESLLADWFESKLT